MHYLSELKEDNELLWSHIEHVVDEAFDDELSTLSEEFANPQSVLKDYLRVPGRGIGGSLVLRAAGIYGSELSDQLGAIRVATATELMNAGILIIDDVIDDSDYRKKQPTVHVAFAQELDNSTRSSERAKAQALQLGVMTVMLASRSFDRIESEAEQQAFENIRRGAFLVSAGQLLESRLMSSIQNDQAEVLSAYRLKTGHYSFEDPINSGLLLAGVDASTRNQFSEFAQTLGLAFQVVDDFDGMFGDPSRTGKSNTDDIRQGTYSLLHHELLQRIPEDKRDQVLDGFGQKNIGFARIVNYKNLAHKNKIDRFGLEFATERTEEAKKMLENLWQDSFSQEARDYFQSLIDFIHGKIWFNLKRL